MTDQVDVSRLTKRQRMALQLNPATLPSEPGRQYYNVFFALGNKIKDKTRQEPVALLPELSDSDEDLDDEEE